MRNPYVTGPYVTGRRHYGRQDLLDNLLHGEANAYWVIGNRRIGKTSLLRQLEALALAGEAGERRFLPIFWDMQGCNAFDGLGRYLQDALQERLDEIETFGLPADYLREENVLTLLPALRRAARSAGRELLLLCDETEVLITLARAEPQLAQRLHAELTRGAGLRVIAVSTRRIYELHDVCRDWPTSPFLAGFDMSYTLGRLDLESARALVTQAQAAEPVTVAPEVVDAICAVTDGHPYLAQLLCARIFQPEGFLRPIEEADLSVDPLLAGFLGNDFGLLSPAEQALVWEIHAQGRASAETLAEALHLDLLDVRANLRELEPLGYLRCERDQFLIGNQFLTRWLMAEERRLGREAGAGSRQAPAPASHPLQEPPAAPLARPPAPTTVRDAAALIEQLNVKRARLVDLEVIRARDLLNASPTVLAEIRQTEQEIHRLLSTLGVSA